MFAVKSGPRLRLWGAHQPAHQGCRSTVADPSHVCYTPVIHRCYDQSDGRSQAIPPRARARMPWVLAGPNLAERTREEARE
jgi:hypothetical protein